MTVLVKLQCGKCRRAEGRLWAARVAEPSVEPVHGKVRFLRLADARDLCAFGRDNGQILYDDTGTAIYDEAERTFGYVDRTKETQANVPLENGKALVSVMTALEPSTVRVIRMRGRWYMVRKLHSGDVASLALRFECTVLSASDFIPI